MNGYTGKILRVDLSAGTTEVREVPDRVYEKLLSGVGLGAWYLYNHIPAGADPLGPDNILGLVSGLLTGTGSVMTGRWMAVCKSPLTGGWGDANCGGTLSPAIKQCGWDGIFFHGKAEKPVYLYGDNKGARLLDASDLWGRDAVTVEEELETRHRVKKKPSVAVIGESAERGSLISGICNDRGRIAARSGVGAVMGAKNLKAVVLAGTRVIKACNPGGMKEISREYSRKVRNLTIPGFIRGGSLTLMGKVLTGTKNIVPMDGIASAPLMKKWGTIMTNTMGVASGDSPLKNWSGSIRDYNRSHYKHINPDRILKKEMRKYHCYSCVIGCGGVCDIKEATGGEFSHTHKPEYETVCAFGGLLMNKDMDSIYYINELLNRAGMDSISAGNTVAFAIECYENGILTDRDTGGLPLKWGNPVAIVSLVKMMIAREGLGDILADGVKIAAEKIGKGAEAYAMHAGGQEPGMHDPRYDPMMGLHFSADPTPGRHTIGCGGYYGYSHLWKKVSWAPKARIHPRDEDYIPNDGDALKSVAGSCLKQVVDGSGGCLFAMISGVQHWRIFDWLNEATGWEKSPDEYMEAGKRMQTLRQMFNVREGIDPVSFKMHERIESPLSSGPTRGRRVATEEMMHLHWKHFGWDERTGVPGEAVIRELGLDNLTGGAE